MHNVQKHILTTLALVGRARYAQLKPGDMEGNRFSCHLKSLMEREYIGRRGFSYHLSTKGKQYVDTLSFKTGAPRVQPKIVTLIYCRDGDTVLFYKRKKEPFMGKWSLPNGKIHLGECIEDAAHRELKEKTGLMGVLTLRGNVSAVIYEDDELLSHTIAYIYEGSELTGELQSDDSVEELSWMRPEELSGEEVFPDLHKILHALDMHEDSLFFEEYRTDIENDSE